MPERAKRSASSGARIPFHPPWSFPRSMRAAFLSRASTRGLLRPVGVGSGARLQIKKGKSGIALPKGEEQAWPPFLSPPTRCVEPVAATCGRRDIFGRILSRLAELEKKSPSRNSDRDQRHRLV
ncbi:hypothetical protein MRX96_029094 [Rhipicephalus microplus]